MQLGTKESMQKIHLPSSLAHSKGIAEEKLFILPILVRLKVVAIRVFLRDFDAAAEHIEQPNRRF